MPIYFIQITFECWYKIKIKSLNFHRVIQKVHCSQKHKMRSRYPNNFFSVRYPSATMSYTRTEPNRASFYGRGSDDDFDDRFSIGRPRWEEVPMEERNPHQIQPLSQYELTGIPEPNFSAAPWRSDRTFTPEEDMWDDYEYYQPRRRFATTSRRRLSSTNNYSLRSSERSTGGLTSYNSNYTRTSVHSNFLASLNGSRTRPSNRTTTTSTSSSNRTGRNIALSTGSTTTATTSTPKKKEEKPKPKVTLKFRQVTEQEVKDETTCAICLEPFEAGKKVAVLKCNHIYHEDCIKPWIESHTTCPVCRTDVADEEKKKK